MPDRHRTPVSALPAHRIRIASALRTCLSRGYRLADLKRDILAGLVVGIVALPLSMALAIASGVPPQHGLYTAIVAGGLIALLGGSPVQVSGPTAAFVVILAPIALQYGLGGLMVATMMAGALLFVAGIMRLGQLIEFIPYPVTTGFTSGIAVVIATMQMRDFFGLTIDHMPEHFHERVQALAIAMPRYHAPDLLIGLLTLAVLVLLPKITRRIPSPLVALPLASAVAYFACRLGHGIEIDTIASRFSYTLNGVTHAGVPQLPPVLAWPWKAPGPGGAEFNLSLATLRALIGPAFAIAMLGAIESLLSAVVADGMTGEKHDPDVELIAQGIGNIASPFFGGIAATGAIARTATNIRSGARSPIAAMTHAVFILLAVLLLAPLLGYLPMASMAALLLVVAWNMSETKHFIHVIRVAPGSDVLVLLTCFALTVLFDMMIAVSVGVVLAALLFMRRMADVSTVQLVSSHPLARQEALPPDVVIYEIAGPLFFGAAQKAMSSLRTVERGIRIVVLDMASVPVMDATGLVNLESAMEKLRRAGANVIIGGARPSVLKLMAKAGWKGRHEWLSIYGTMEEALRKARDLPRRTISSRSGALSLTRPNHQKSR
ncbi:MAG: C4-dicarboxylic acid transporter DauA [Planctomycetia bacterium]|nr:MAG: C4-dicarboxylic acid transporter DauA [Planctomycetia bacterium]